ncbi:MAG: hypothetical protein EOO81_01735 [Oxalobacteraceae bacterium]|nr:MAG: hypothetical protein EOO81_01735 [Oxalobacteraceae bacterium]
MALRKWILASANSAPATKREELDEGPVRRFTKACKCGGKREVFCPVSNHARGRTASITPDCAYKMLVSYANELRVDVAGFGPHAPRTTAATSALKHGADIAKIQQWLGHADVATTKVYNQRQSRPEDSPTFKVACWPLMRAQVMKPSFPATLKAKDQAACLFTDAVMNTWDRQ